MLLGLAAKVKLSLDAAWSYPNIRRTTSPPRGIMPWDIQRLHRRTIPYLPTSHEEV